VGCTLAVAAVDRSIDLIIAMRQTMTNSTPDAAEVQQTSNSTPAAPKHATNNEFGA
jgi:hypothetical protein